MKWTADEFTGKRFGKYEVLCRLAVGGMAELFLGFARSGPFIGRPVVMKRILHEQRDDPVALQMLVDEAKMTATLSHPNVAQVLDLEAAGEEILLVIEFINGATLEELVETHASRHELLPLGFVITTIREIAQGLAHAHAHRNARGERFPIIHRDVSPRNVMVNFGGSIKVLDFGIARIKGGERRTRIGMVRGTTAYMSPEQAIGQELDPRSDLFSLGVIFHELLTGHRLFYRGNPAEEMAAVYEAEIPLPSRTNRRVSSALDPIVMRLLERTLEMRYQSAREFVSDLTASMGANAWGKERCAELICNRLSSRQTDIEKLLALIPQLSSTSSSYSATQSINSPAPIPSAKPERLMATERRSPEAVRSALASDADTAVGLAEKQPRRPSTPPRRTPERDAPTAVKPNQSTRILQGETPRALSRNVDVLEAPTGHIAEPRSGVSRSMLIFAVSLALVLGAIGGAGASRYLQKASPASMVRLSLDADRPAEVWLGVQELGVTPISVLMPSGRHLLEVREADGPRRALDVDLSSAQSEMNMAVSLDSLPALP